MVSNFPRSFVASDEFATHAGRTTQAEGVRERVLDRVREALCGLHGHDSLPQFQQDRMFLKCVSCGHESPGWELNERPPAVVVRANNRRQALAPSKLIGERRIA